jgi:hypothetical protein
VRQDEEDRAVRGQAGHEQEAVAGEATRGQGRADATPPPPDPRARAMAGERGARAQRLLRRARQHRRGRGLPQPGGPALAAGAAAPQPAHPPDLGTHAPPRQTMATNRPHPASLAQRALRRSYPRQEHQCAKRARWDLRGGPPATAVPTATKPRRPEPDRDEPRASTRSNALCAARGSSSDLGVSGSASVRCRRRRRVRVVSGW